jgi:hypothetical protein
MNTYWKRSPRKFQNEYTVGVATTRADAKRYEDDGYTRVHRSYALRLMSDRGATEARTIVYVTVNGDPAWDRFTMARVIRKGEDLHTCP